MEYFNLNGILSYSKEAGNPYHPDGPGASIYYDTRNKLNFLVTKLNETNPFELINNYNEKPNQQAGQGMGFVLKNYILIGCIPKKWHAVVNDLLFVKFYFGKPDIGQATFYLEADVNFKKLNNKFIDDRDELRNNTSYSYVMDFTFPKTWENLIEKILPDLESILNYVDKYLTNKTLIEPMTSNIENSKSKSEKYPLNQILFGPPGTGKTYNTVNKAIAIANTAFDLSKPREEIKSEFDRLIKEGQIVFSTFHQSMSYEDFIEGIKPMPPKGDNGPVIYKVQDGIFKKIAHEAQQKKLKSVKVGTEVQELTEELFEDFYFQFVETLVGADEEESNCVLKTTEGNEFGLYKNTSGSITIKAGLKKTKMSAALNELTQVLFYGKSPTYKSYEHKIIQKILEDKSYSESTSDKTQKKFVLIIDEINRGNVSQIFGELITLIEEDKRLGKEETLEAILPYSKEKFGVPPNLYIIGTMNTADRSVEALDAALRRRFSFEEMPPKPELIALKGKLKAENGVLGDISLTNLLETINKRIEKLLDKDHQIGHSYFMSVSSLDDLQEVFYNKIIPLLQEYFFGDYGKLGLVLGKGFVAQKTWNKDTDSFADFDAESASDYDEKTVFKIIDYRSQPLDYSIKINRGKEGITVQLNFEKAIKHLMILPIE